jgi:SPASM domain peptide maturase of grasp-with-spasm system
MPKDWAQHSNLFLQLFADCIPVKGAVRSAFYDLTRHEIILFPTEYYSLMEDLLGKRIGDILETTQSNPNKEKIISFLDFMDDNELIMLVDDPSQFPPIADSWDFPGLVQNAVIDISTVFHDFPKIFDELSAMGCQHVQVRCFSNLLTLNSCRSLLENARHKSIVGIELILKYETGVLDDAYVTFVKQQPMLTALTVHSAPQSKCVVVDSTAPVYYDGAPLREFRFTSQVVDSELHCGMVTQKYLTPPSVGTFFEAKSFNGCLNRKISIDASGNIRNCPSMKDSYGNVRNSSLLDAVHAVGFKDKWGVSKDHISVCRDCEFRYACSDCRAYLENPDDGFSKPLKCGYDPYSGVWNEWTENPNKMMAAKLYGMELLLRQRKGPPPAVPT